MLYLDRTLNIQDIRLPSGATVHGMQLGSHTYEGKRHIGRSLVLAAPDNLGKCLKKGFYADLSVGQQSGQFGLERVENNRIILILSSRPVGKKYDQPELWLRGAVGTIKIPRTQKANCITRSRAACRKYNNTSRWEEAILSARPGDAFLLTWSSADGAMSWRRVIYVAGPDRIVDCPLEQLHECCSRFGIMTTSLPFTNYRDGDTGASCIERSEWRKL